METFLPVGKGIQGATSHCLGQNFAKAFDITFLDEKGEKQYVWQNSWGITTRSIGMMILMHGDDKGLILPPRIAPIQIVIIPILFDNTKKEVVKKCEEIEKKLKEYKVHFDEREEYTPGFKYNEWELKGVPLRLELGPKDLEKKQIVVVRRDTGKKEFVLIKDIEQKIPELLEDIQKSLFQKAEAGIKSNTIEVNSFTEFKKAIQNKKRVKAIWCTKESCEEKIKESTEGAKSLNIPFNQKKIKGKCFHCGEPADSFAYFGKSY